MVKISLAPQVVDLEGIRAGDRNELAISVTQVGRPIDLTDYTVTAQARAKSTDATPAISAEIEMIDEAAGKFRLRWPGDDVAALLDDAAYWSGVWDLQVDDGSGDPTTLAAGSWSASMDVTRP